MYMMVSVSAVEHNILYLTYDKEERECESENYMWAMRLLARVMKNKEYISFCKFLKIANKSGWHLVPNTAACGKEIIYLFHYNIMDDKGDQE